MDGSHRGKHVKRKRQRQMYETEHNKLNYTLQQYLKPLHPVHVLSKHGFAKIEDNNIVLEDLKCTIIKSGKRINQQKIYTVNRKNIGKNLRTHIKPNTHYNVVFVDQIKKCFITVTTRVCPNIIDDDRIELIGHVPENSSGMILLMISTFNDQIRNEQNVDEKYNVDQNGYSFGPYARKDSFFSNNHIAECNKIMEYLLNLSLKLPKQIIPNIYRNTSVVGYAVKDHLRKIGRASCRERVS